jgi:hypothetical protein
VLLCDFELFDFVALCMRPELPLVEPEPEPDIEPEVEPIEPEPEVELIEPEPDVLPIEPEPEVLPLVEPEVLPIEPEVLPLVEPDVLPPVVLPVVVWAKAVPEVRAKAKTKATA